MANNIKLIAKYIPLLDEVYKLNSLTADLDSDASLAKAGANTNEIVIPRISMDGLADYSRNSGYVDGDVTLEWQTVKFNFDRGRMFTVDTMDDEETAHLAFGRLASEFIRTKFVPELDAFRFATYASANGISSVSGALADGKAVMTALKDAITKMDNDEVPQEGRRLFILPDHYNAVLNLDTTASKAIWQSFASVRKIPKSRFYTKIKQNDGKTEGQTQGGYAKATDGKDINLMIIHPTALMQYTKHAVPKVIDPNTNQGADAWKFGYRNYGLADVYVNKVAGIYLHSQA